MAFVLGLGVDHQAVGAVGDRLRAERRLAGRVGAVHVLPGAHFQPVGVQFRDELRRELAPVVARAVGALDEHASHARRVRLGDDRGDVPPLDLLTYQIHMPWPSKAPAADGADRAPARSASATGGCSAWRDDVDRAVGARVAPAAQQHHDAPGVRAASGPSRAAPRVVLAQVRGGRARADRARPATRGKPIAIPALQAHALRRSSGAVRGHLVRVGAAAAPRGMQLTLVMRTLVTCGARVPRRGAACAGVFAPARARARRGAARRSRRPRRSRAAQHRQRDRAQRARRRENRRCACARRDHESLSCRLTCHGKRSRVRRCCRGGRTEVSRLCGCRTEQRDGSCAQPQRKPRRPRAPARAGCDGRPGGRARQVEAASARRRWARRRGTARRGTGSARGPTPSSNCPPP